MLYLDTSAVVKLVRTERESEALLQAAAGRQLLSSELLVTEVHRALTLHADTEGHRRADTLLDAVGLIALTRPLLNRAGSLPPVRLRSLDAIHLAAALRVADLIDAVVTYDVRLAEAARAHGLAVWSPGAP